jgi:hypothetical protein
LPASRIFVLSDGNGTHALHITVTGKCDTSIDQIRVLPTGIMTMTTMAMAVENHIRETRQTCVDIWAGTYDGLRAVLTLETF